jgi:tetratricopeptide (TPR) repeat protein
MPKLIPLVLAAILALPSQRSNRPEALPSAAEFPPQDRALWFFVSEDIIRNASAKRLVDAPASPDTVRFLAAAKNLEGLLATLRRIVDTEPRRIPDALEAMGESVWEFRGDSAQIRANAETLRRIAADARLRLTELPREEAARAGRVLLMIDAQLSPDRNAYSTGLARFVEQYRGTEAALLAEVDLIANRGVSQQMLDALDAFAQAHPGTRAAAKALYEKGFQWHTINTLGTIEPRGTDPSTRFMRVLAVVNELESGRYPTCEWTEKAPSLISEFFFPDDARIPPDNLDRVIGAIEEFAATHFQLDPAYPAASGVGYLLVSRLPALYEQKGQRTTGMDETFARLERRVVDAAAVRYLRGMFHLLVPRSETPEARSARLDRVRQELRAVSMEGRALVHRQALATLASLDFGEKRYGDARASFQKYATSYPDSNWSMVAMLRIGQCDEALGDAGAAAQAYLNAARNQPGVTIAQVLGHEYAARAFETTGEFALALEAHQKALDSWNTPSARYTTYWRRAASADDPFAVREDAAEVTRESLEPRIAQLRQSLAVSGGARVERVRMLVARGRYDEALEQSQRLIAESPALALAREARELGHHARLARALEWAAVDRPPADEARALVELETLAREPLDFSVTAARIARASLQARRGERSQAEPALTEALTDWRAAQRVTPPAAGLETDVAEIRRAVFLPHGGEIYASGRWNDFAWPATPPPFTLVNSDVRVKRHDGVVTRVTLIQDFAGEHRTVFFNTGQIAVLQKMITTLGGTKRREPRQIMETPNQPVGDSMQILALWTRLFPARPGHWGGWELETYPVITEIEFTNAERTRAGVRVTIGYSGATVELEKEAGRWIAKRLTNQWIT